MLKTILKTIRNQIFSLVINFKINRNRKRVKRKIKQKQVLNVLFIVQHPEMWNSEKTLYEKMLQHPFFRPTLLCIPKCIFNDLCGGCCFRDLDATAKKGATIVIATDFKKVLNFFAYLNARIEVATEQTEKIIATINAAICEVLIHVKSSIALPKSDNFNIIPP